MPRIVHFEMGAADPERASAFYEQVFGWKIEKWDGPIDYWLVMTGEEEAGIDGGIVRREQFANNAVNTIDVPDVDRYIEQIERAGGKIAQPKMAIPGVGYMAYMFDTEGNRFGIMQSDTEAK